MTADEIRATLVAGSAVRMPRFTADMEVRDRVDVLEDYLNLTAVLRGQLEEARLHAYAAAAQLAEDWDAIEGWQINLPRGSRTQADVTEAKRLCRPDLYDAITTSKWLAARLGEQIHRLELDDKATSRLYSIITGS